MHRRSVTRFAHCSLWLLTLLPLPSQAAAPEGDDTLPCPVVRMDIERLPDLHIPRIGHNTVLAGGEPLVVGGHTTGFVPTTVAEIFSDGKWQQLTTVYPHDHGLCVPLRSGRVLFAGGHAEPLGIGQTFTMETYDPATRTFAGYGCLDEKRVFASGVEMADGKVVISGNWYAEDGIEYYDSAVNNTFIDSVAQPRALPFMLPVSPHELLIFGGFDCKANLYDSIIVDRLQGESFHVPLLDEWQPIVHPYPGNTTSSPIDTEGEGAFTFLLPALHRETRQMGIIQVHDTCFTLLPTASPVPMSSEWGPIEWFSGIITDRQAHRGYVLGHDGNVNSRYYVLAVDYSRRPVPLVLYHTDLLDSCLYTIPIVTPEGNLLLAGGITDNNFSPSARVMLFRLSKSPLPPTMSLWPWLFAVAVLAVGAIAVFLFRRRRPTAAVADAPDAEPGDKDRADDQLVRRISQLMDEQQLFLRADLKLSDVAKLIDVNSRIISDALKSSRGCSFSLFVNGYRVNYAKQLLRQQPEMKLAAVAMRSGFANETSFFRTFKALTGTTPREWVAQEAND